MKSIYTNKFLSYLYIYVIYRVYIYNNFIVFIYIYEIK